jgi:hypothetical protein
MSIGYLTKLYSAKSIVYFWITVRNIIFFTDHRSSRIQSSRWDSKIEPSDATKATAQCFAHDDVLPFPSTTLRSFRTHDSMGIEYGPHDSLFNRPESKATSMETVDHSIHSFSTRTETVYRCRMEPVRLEIRRNSEAIFSRRQVLSCLSRDFLELLGCLGISRGSLLSLIGRN